MQPVSSALQARHAADARRELEIIDAVLQLLSESGYDALSVDELARRVKASKATIYGRWGGKKPLVLAAVRHVIRPVEDIDNGDLRTDLIAIGRTADLSEDRAASVMLAIAHAATVDPEFAGSIDDNLAAPYRAAVHGAVAKAVARGELRSEALELGYVTDVIPSLALGRRVFGAAEPIDVATVIDTVVLPALRNA